MVIFLLLEFNRIWPSLLLSILLKSVHPPIVPAVLAVILSAVMSPVIVALVAVIAPACVTLNAGVPPVPAVKA